MTNDATCPCFYREAIVVVVGAAFDFSAMKVLQSDLEVSCFYRSESASQFDGSPAIKWRIVETGLLWRLNNNTEFVRYVLAKALFPLVERAVLPWTDWKAVDAGSRRVSRRRLSECGAIMARSTAAYCTKNDV